MKVSALLKQLNDLNPDDEICALYWTKEAYDYRDIEEEEITREAWVEICKEFDECDNAGLDVSEWIADAVIEKTNLKS
jgi:hypothetical protein